MERGDVLVIGNSGVGKSTLINAVLGEEKMLYKYECYILIIFRHEKIMNLEVLIIWRVNTCYKIFFFHIT